MIFENMMIRIFVEGPTDKKFLTDLIQRRLMRLIPDDLFVETGGWGGLFNKDDSLFRENNLNILRIVNAQNGVNLVVFDTDHNFEERRRVLLEKAELNDVTFELFLFPDNQNTGDRETLLLQIVNPIAFLPVSQCFTPYFDCLQKVNEQRRIDTGNNLKIWPKKEERKMGLINYLQFHGQETSERKRDYTNPEYWNLYDPALNELIQFLTPFFGE